MKGEVWILRRLVQGICQPNPYEILRNEATIFNNLGYIKVIKQVQGISYQMVLISWQIIDERNVANYILMQERLQTGLLRA